MCRRRLFASPSPREKRRQEAQRTPLSPPPLTLLPPPPPPREPRAGGCTACPRAAAAGARARPHPPPARLAQLPLLPLRGRPTAAAAAAARAGPDPSSPPGAARSSLGRVKAPRPAAALGGPRRPTRPRPPQKLITKNNSREKWRVKSKMAAGPQHRPLHPLSGNESQPRPEPPAPTAPRPRAPHAPRLTSPLARPRGPRGSCRPRGSRPGSWRHAAASGARASSPHSPGASLPSPQSRRRPR